MKRLVRLILFITLFNIVMIKSYAIECSYDELASLTSEAALINVSYEEKDNYFNLNIQGLSNKFYLEPEVYGENFDAVNLGEYIYGDVNNSYSYMWTYINDKYQVKFEVYSSNMTNCEGEKITTKTISLPVFNEFYTRKECINNEDAYVCKKFTTNKMTQNEFEKYFENKTTIDVDTDKNVKKVINNNDSKIVKFIKRNKIFVVSVILLIVFGIITGVILYKNKKRMF